MRDRFKNEIGKSQKCRQQKVGSPLAAPPTLPTPATHCHRFLVSARSSRIPLGHGWRGRHVCVHAHTHTDTLQAQKVASGLTPWRRQASAIGPREHLNPGRPALSPWAGSWVSESGPPLFKALLGHLEFPLSPPLGVLSTCLPALQRDWQPPLPSSPAPFPTQSYQAGATLPPAALCGVPTPHRDTGARGPVPGTLGHAPRPQPPPWT